MGEFVGGGFWVLRVGERRGDLGKGVISGPELMGGVGGPTICGGWLLIVCRRSFGGASWHGHARCLFPSKCLG
jgi:hypothetical protein